jgi:uncharacterized damage-inducible protein DinB
MAMISGDWVRMMAQYNHWQNSVMAQSMSSLTPAQLTEDRGAFFGSILGTANHLLWGDQMWMSRFDGGAVPEVGVKDSAAMLPTGDAWAADRQRMDQRITLWAQGLSAVALASDLTWYSGAAGRELSRPMSLCVSHFFNHQTHHRGQIHAMLTSFGAKTQDSDLFLMPGLS